VGAEFRFGPACPDREPHAGQGVVRAYLTFDDIALWEIHEAFSAQVLCHLKALEEEAERFYEAQRDRSPVRSTKRFTRNGSETAADRHHP
jgi:hypothetical protein